MNGRPLAAALALVLALGDVSWAVTVVRAVPATGGASASGVAGAARLAPAALTLTPAALRTASGPVLLSPTAPTFVAPQDAPAPAPAAALPQLAAVAEPAAAPGASAAAERDEGLKRWDAANAAEPREDADAVLAAPADAPSPSGLSAATPAAPAAARAIPLPRVGLARAGQFAAWSALILLASLTHLPFDRLAPLFLGVGLGVAAGFMAAFYAVAAQNEPGWGFGDGPGERPVTEAEKAELGERVVALAKEGGQTAPKDLVVVETDVLNAQVSPEQVRVYGGILDLPRGQQDAILRHEVAHLRHNDSAWTGANFFIAAVPASIALMGGMNADWLAALAAPALIAGLALVGESKKRAEYHADQYAAAREGTGLTLVAAFREMKRRDDEEAARPSKTRLEAFVRASSAAWGRVARLWGSHPPIEKRIARLERLSAGR